MIHDARVGTLVSEHRIIRLLAEGDSWCTYLAERFSHRSVLRITNIGADPAMASRLAAMHDVASRLVSPGLVAVEEVGTTKDGATFVRQSFAGESLASRLARGDVFDNVVNLGTRHTAMPVDQARPLVSTVLLALDDGHAAGLVHRDVRPGAIFVDGDTTRLGSFGLPSSAHPWDGSDEAIRFWSPEQAMGLDEQLDGRADLFAVGALLRRLVTGRDLHEGLGRVEAQVVAATKPVPPVASLGLAIPSALAAVIDRAMAWDRRDRYTTALAMRDALR